MTSYTVSHGFKMKSALAYLIGLMCFFSFSPSALAQVNIVKSTSETSVGSGDCFEYTISLECSNVFSACDNVTVTDQLSQYLVLSDDYTTPLSYTYDEMTGEIIWDIGTMSAGSNLDIVYEVCIPAGTIEDNAIIENEASVTDGVTTDISSASDVSINTDISWEVSKSVTSGPIYHDTPVTYEIQVCNNAGTVGTQNLSDAMLFDELPPGAVFVDADGGGMYDGMTNMIEWNLGLLDVNLLGCLSFEVILTYPSTDPLNDTGFNPGTPLPKDNTAVLMGTPPTGPANPMPAGFSTDGTAVGPLLPPTFSLATSKTASDEGILVLDSTSVFSIGMENTGTSTLVNVTVTDDVPAELSLLELRIGACPLTGTTLNDVMYSITFNYAAKPGAMGMPGSQNVGPFDVAASQVTDITALIDTATFYVTDYVITYDSVPPSFNCSVVMLVTDGLIADLASTTGYYDNEGNEYDLCTDFTNCAAVDGNSTMGFPGVDVTEVSDCDDMAIVPMSGRMDPNKTVEIDYVDPPAGGSTTGNPYFQGARVKFCVTLENDGPDEGVSSFSVLEDVLGTDILPEYLTFDDGDPMTPEWWIENDNTGNHAIGSMGLGISFTNEANTPNPNETRLTWRFAQDFEINDQVEICFYATIDTDAPDGQSLTNNFCMNSNTAIFCDDNAFGKPNNHPTINSQDPVDYVPAADLLAMENMDICCKSTTITVKDSTAVPDVMKSIVSSGPYLPSGNPNIPMSGTDTIEYQIVLQNNTLANAVMPNPEVYDLLSEKVTFVPGSFEITANTTGLAFDDMGGNPSFSLQEDFVAGQDLAQWVFAGDFPIGGQVTYRFKVAINVGAGGAVENTVYAITPDENQECITSSADVNDLNQNMDTGELLCESTSASINIITNASINSSKWVQGPDDTEWLRFPDIAKTYPNDTLQFRMLLFNAGNVPLDRLSIVDILPFVGDVGVRTGQPRTTEWRPFLEGPITVPAGCNIFYTTEAEPCRDTYPIDVNDMGGPSGCSPAAWVNAAAVSDWSAIQAFYITCDATIFNPADTMEIIWRMRAPSDAPPGRACNSFAYRADRVDNGSTFKAEPILACIELEIDTIGDYVWFDENGDGIQDMGESPLENLSMALFDTLGNLVATTVTDVNGFYKFSSILDASESWVSTPGLDQYVHPFTPYYVVAAYDIATSSGANNGTILSYFPDFDISLTSEDQGSDDLVDSDGALGGAGDPAFLQGLIFDSVYTDIPIADYSYDFGFSPVAEIGDYVWFDANLNGLQDPIEPGVPGVTVYLLDKNMDRIIDPTTMNPISQVTDINGFYSFESVPADADSDTFFLEFALNDIMGVIPTPLQDPVVNINGAMDSELDSDLSLLPFGDGFKTDEIIVFPGDSIPTVDAGIVGQDTIGDFVFEDVNGNGIQDAMDLPIEGVQVYLIVNGTVLDSTLTDISGEYEFPGLLFGPDYTYKIMFDTPMGFFPTLFNDPFMIGNEGIESDADPSMMLMTETYNFVDPAFSYLDLDAGFVRPVSIGDTAFIDTDLDGLQALQDPGLEGVLVTLYSQDPTLGSYAEVTVDLNGDPVVPQVTNSDGYYYFDSLPPGNYFVNFDAGIRPSTTEDVNNNMNDDQDSDIDALGNSDTLLVTSGMFDASFDAGYLGIDFGDLPEEYVTTLATDGLNAPRHIIFDGHYLGTLVDDDTDGAPSADGLGDDNTGSTYVLPSGATGDDEDGIEFLSPMIPGNVAYVKITYSSANDAFINAFIDFDGDMVLDPVEFVSVDGTPITATTNLGIAGGTDVMIVAAFNVPDGSGFRDGLAYSRFRLSSAGSLASDGIALDGEIEDYVTSLGKIGNLVWLDENFDGLQDPTAPEQVLANVPVVLSYDFTRGNITFEINDTLFTDINGLYSFCGLVGSNEGIYQLTVLTPDGLAGSKANQGDVALDSDNTIEYGEEGRDSVQSAPFMITDVTGLPTNEAGQGDDPNTINGFPDNQFDQTYDFGFVPIDFGDLPELDFGDLPIRYQTSEDGSPNPARHIVTSNKRLGSCIDSELDGQPDEMGMGDDDNMDDTDEEFSFGDCSSGSDEDGIEFLTPMIPGDSAYIKVTYTLPPAADGGNVAGFLNGWIDFNGNGRFNNGDRVRAFSIDGVDLNNDRRNIRLEAGTDTMVIIGFLVPETATFNGGMAFTRFRLSCEGGLGANGVYDDGRIPEGEVEDYVIPLGKIGNLVWLDQDYDGIQDTMSAAEEEGIEGVEVLLTYTIVDEANGIDLTIVDTMFTDAEGKYGFCGLIESDLGEYKLTVIAPESMTPTVSNNATGGDILDSDHTMNSGDTIVMTDIFQITDLQLFPRGEDGLNDDPNIVGTFADSLVNQSFDFGFVPLDYGDLDSTTFATVKGDNGAVHVISENKYLGLGADAEIEAAADTIAGATVDGDDNTLSAYSLPSGTSITDDEDGIQFITPLIPGFEATIEVVYTSEEQDAYLNGWIDFNGNGILDPSEALIFYTDVLAPNTDGLLSMGTNQTVELSFIVPSDAVYNEGDVHARFRLSCDGGLEPTGGFPAPAQDGPQAPQGEVEDYYLPLGKIGNLAFFDNDLDGSQDGNVGVNPEIGIEGVNNTLIFAGFGSSGFEDGDEIEYPVTTDANGNYYVCGLIPGEYDMIPTKYLDDAITPEDTIPVRYILTAANCDSDDDLDSDFVPNLAFTIPDLLSNDLVVGEDGYTDEPGNVGFPDEQDQVNFDQGWIPEPNIEAIANIAGVDYPTSGICRNFNVIADVCIQNTGYVEMNGELIGARLENIDIDINLGEQFMGAFVGVIGDPIILDTVEYEEAFMLIDDDDRPSENPDFDGINDIDGSLVDGIIEPSEIVCLRIMFEIAPDELSDEDAMNLSFNAVVSGMAINADGKEMPDYFNGGQQYVAVDSSDRVFMFNGTYDDPDEPEPLTNCYETTKDLSVQSSVNLSYDETCMAMITPQMMLTKMDMTCDNDDYPLGGYYRLQLEDLNGNVIIPYTDSLILDDPAFIGNMYNVSIQTVSEKCNSAWGKVTIENKYPPIIECANDTITCGQLLVLPPPTVLNNCGEINLTLLDRTTVDVACEDPNLQLIVTETWIAIDPNGLRSDTCTQTLSVEKFDINDVVGPSVTDTLLNCSVGTMPSPEDLGVPTLNGVDLYPDNFAECGIFVSYEDEFFSFGNDCSSGVQRTWLVQNWICGTDNSKTFTQLITFVDTTGPVLSDIPSDMTVSTSGFDCEAAVVIPAITAEDDCNPADIRVDINYEGGFQMDENGATINLPVGTSTVTYIVYDVCGNTSTASFNVTVRDLQQPVTICDAFTTVSLNSEGLASLGASKLDNGSMDECGPVDLAIRRMDDDLGFMEEVDFSCADIGPENIMVALRVTDLSGNSNVCMAQVELQDKVPPVLVSGLPDITISCTFPFDMDNLSVFGTIVNDVDSIQPIIIDDEAVQFSGPARDGLILDNCSTAEMSEITSGDLDNCGNGTLIRTIIATSPNGEQISLNQRITLVNPTPFLERDITWPDDITLNQCTDAGLNPLNFPEGQGFPIYEEDNCDMVSSTYEDKILSNTPDGGGCLVIERTWFVSDWCQRVNDQFVIFEDVQMITINNDVAPVITSACEDIYVESLDGECGDVFVTLTASATDDCVMSENLIWTYEIDAFSDGSVDIIGEGNDASGSYPVGVHEIRFLVADGCGNISECVYSFELVNVKVATPLCFQGLSAGLTPMDTIGDSAPDAELLMLTPDFVDAGSSHPCGYDLRLSFSADVNDTLRVFGCDDLGQQPIQLWVTDPNGNQDFCATFIIVEDNNEVDLCPENNEMVDIGGALYTEEDVMISEVDLFMSDTDIKAVTDADGSYSFGEMPRGGDYSIEPIKDIDHRNGVTTLDLILIQKHILGVTPITSPYKLLAADINNSGTITGSDLLELRKLILGLYDSFPNNTSWRFVDAGYNFIDPANPWAQTIPEQYEIYNLSSDMEIDFYGLKVGDINGSVELNGQQITAEVRNVEEPFELSFDDRMVSKGETVLVPFYGDKINTILGYQFTMNIDDRKADMEEVESLCGGIAQLNFGERYMAEGYLTSSWSNADDKEMKPESALFGIKVTAKEDLKLSEVLSLSSDIASTEAYTKAGEVIELVLRLREEVSDVQGVPALYQNQPNPWIKNTVISFNLPEATDATLRIFDVTGKLVKVHRSAYEAGVHEYELIEQDFSSRGVYYYELITNDYQMSKKMVLIK